MIKVRHVFSGLLSTVLVSLSLCSSAQVVDVSGCRAIEDRLQRFDCYERLDAADAVSPPQAPERVVTPAPQRANTPAVAQPAERAQRSSDADARDSVVNTDRNVDTFGRQSEADKARLIESKRGNTELVDTLAAIEQRAPSLALVTLTSGQKWLQMISKRYPIKVGDEVRIYPSRWGSAYRLTATRVSGYIQVQRLE